MSEQRRKIQLDAQHRSLSMPTIQGLLNRQSYTQSAITQQTARAAEVHAAAGFRYWTVTITVEVVRPNSFVALRV
jgi:hypothetical protein